MSASAEAASQLWFAEARVQTLGAGHIHDTYLLSLPDTPQRYVLQCLNETVFRDAALVMQQTQRLLAHWQQQSRYQVATLQPSLRGEIAERLESRLWRVWQFIPASRVLEPLAVPAQAYAAGSAFGYFQSYLNHLEGPRFADTIQGFLQLQHYLEAFAAVASDAPTSLRRLIDDHTDLAARFAERNCFIHGDCKVNNLLFAAESDDVLAIIDFDTAMYGHWAWDFGDLMRSICHSRGHVELEIFSACLRGFAAEQRQANAADCVAAPAYVALMLGVRFLTDHLQDDVYFKVDRRGDNLTRARQQFSLFEDLLDQRDAMLRAADEVFEALT